MTTHTTSQGAGLARAYAHWRERGALHDLADPKDVNPQPVTIAISRETGAGGGKIARKVAEKLNWPLYDRELVAQIALEAGVRAELLGPLDEKLPSWIDECLNSFTNEKSMSGVGFAIRLREILFALYCHGNCVVLGRGAAHVLPAKHTLRIRLIAEKLSRIQRATNHLGTSEEADRQITELDRERAEFVRTYFHKDLTDPHGYDLTIDTSRFNESVCVDLIIAALNARQERHQSNVCSSSASNRREA